MKTGADLLEDGRRAIIRETVASVLRVIEDGHQLGTAGHFGWLDGVSDENKTRLRALRERLRASTSVEGG